MTRMTRICRDLPRAWHSPDGRACSRASGVPTFSIRAICVIRGQFHRRFQDESSANPDIADARDRSSCHLSIRTLTSFLGRIESLTFSPDGKTLATGGGGGDPMVRLWDLAALKE